MHIYIYKHMEVKVRRTFCSLHWRHNDHDGVLNHQPHGCLLNLLFQRRSKKNIKVPRHWPLCGEFTVAGEFPAQRDSNVENASIWWRHHGYNVSDHHVKSDTEQCCNNWRICLLNERMEQWGLDLDKIKFQTWGPIYVIDCWPLEVDLKETNKFLFIACRVS